MTTRPQLKPGLHLVPGLATAALFAVVAVVFLGVPFPGPQGFSEGANVTASISYPMLNFGFGSVDSESMLVVFETVDLVSIAAFAGMMLLARHEGTTGQTRTILTDGGWELKQMLSDDKEGDN